MPRGSDYQNQVEHGEMPPEPFARARIIRGALGYLKATPEAQLREYRKRVAVEQAASIVRNTTDVDLVTAPHETPAQRPEPEMPVRQLSVDQLSEIVKRLAA